MSIDDFTDEDLNGSNKTFLKLIQRATPEPPEGAKVGDLVDPRSGEKLNGARFTFVDADPARVYFAGGAKVCESKDSKAPASWINNPQSDDCLTCDKAQTKECRKQVEIHASCEGADFVLVAKGWGQSAAGSLVKEAKSAKAKGQSISFVARTEIPERDPNKNYTLAFSDIELIGEATPASDQPPAGDDLPF